MYLLPHAPAADGPLETGVIACVFYLILVYAIDVVLLLVAVVENAARRRQSRTEDYTTIGTSRFTIPVSVIAPMHNEEVLAVPVIDALLALDYPEYEVIIINDGSTDGTLDLLRRRYALRQFERFERRVLDTTEVHAVYRSTVNERLTVIDQVAGGNKAAALNADLNFARFRYVCCIDGDTIYSPDTLLRSMRLVLRDPAHVIGVTSQIVVTTHPEEAYVDGKGLIGSTLLHNFQHLEYLRSFS